MPYCHPTPEPLTCGLCRRYISDPAFAAVLDAVPAPRAKPAARTPSAAPAPCIHLGPPTGASVQCPSCRGTVSLKVFACAVHTTCTLARRVEGHGCCVGCKQKELRASGSEVDPR